MNWIRIRRKWNQKNKRSPALCLHYNRVFIITGAVSSLSIVCFNILASRMRLFVGLLHHGGVDMGINLSRHEIFMAQKFLNGANIRPRVQEMGCETVPKRVRRCLAVQAGGRQIFIEHSGDATCGEPVPLRIQKDRPILFGRMMGRGSGSSG